MTLDETCAALEAGLAGEAVAAADSRLQRAAHALKGGRGPKARRAGRADLRRSAVDFALALSAAARPDEVSRREEAELALAQAVGALAELAKRVGDAGDELKDAAARALAFVSRARALWKDGV